MPSFWPNIPRQVVLTYDGDEAGQNATRRAIPMLERAGSPGEEFSA